MSTLSERQLLARFEAGASEAFDLNLNLAIEHFAKVLALRDFVHSESTYDATIELLGSRYDMELRTLRARP